MNANTTSSNVVNGGAQALQALGAGAEAGRLALEEVKSLTSSIENAASVTAEDVEELGDAVQKVRILITSIHVDCISIRHQYAQLTFAHGSDNAFLEYYSFC